MVDLSNLYRTGLGMLQTWRSRYSLEEYPEKVLLNIFYWKYTTDFMWNDIENCFQTNGQKKWANFDLGLEKMNDIYSTVAGAKTQSQLPNLLKLSPSRIVGNLTYSSYNERIIKAKRGSSIDIEEIEFAYLYYLLVDQAILMWASFGGLGYNKIDAIAQVSSVIIKSAPINSYSTIESVLGKLLVSPFLDKNYRALPSMR